VAAEGAAVSQRAAAGVPAPRSQPSPHHQQAREFHSEQKLNFQNGEIMAYVDGFVVPVPKKNRNAYVRMARKAGKVWREHGALDYKECIADDVKPGKYTSFPQSVKLKKNEVVWFSWIVYKNRKHRDRVLAKVMKDKRLKPMMDPKAMPFDGKRMFWGGFKVMVDL
jgi:uncharacterized protein YbaA (DUF1428 family)